MTSFRGTSHFPHVRAGRGDDYADVADLLHTLRRMPAQSPERCRQRETIIVRCLPLADDTAVHFSRGNEELDDVIQIARLGLVLAVDGFGTSKHQSFIGYAMSVIVAEARLYFRSEPTLLPIPQRICDLQTKVDLAQQRLAKTLKRPPTLGELAASAGIMDETLVEYLLCAHVYGLQPPMARTTAAEPRTPKVTARFDAGDESIQRVVDRETLRVLVARLPVRERRLMEMRFTQLMTLREIAAKQTTTTETVMSILSRAFARIREQLEQQS